MPQTETVAPFIKGASLFGFLDPIFRLLFALPLVGGFLDFVSLFLCAVAFRFMRNRHVAKGALKSKRPKKALKLFAIEGCANCSRVFDLLTHLDLDALVFPCPSGGKVWRTEAVAIGGKAQFPFLVDENVVSSEGKVLKVYDRKDIEKYLWLLYGAKAKRSLLFKIEELAVALIPGVPFTNTLAALCRPVRELLYAYDYIYADKARRRRLDRTCFRELKPLELWAYEGSPFCLRVKAALCQLEIPYLLRNVASGSVHKRDEFRLRFGHKLGVLRKTLGWIQVPLLVDPNRDGVVVTESKDIVKYLMEHYT